MSLPDPAPILDLIDAFRRSKAMFTAATLGVFEALHDGPADLGTLAARLNVKDHALVRLLDACVGLGLLRKENGKYANQPVAEAYLCEHSDYSLAGYVRYSDEALYPMWGNLADAVREGNDRWTQTFGWHGPLFDHFFKTEERKRTFLQGMHGFGQLSSPAIVAACDLSGFRRMVDLGGATGHLVIAACKRYPQLRAAVFDLLPVIESAREYVSGVGAADRIDLIAGDFFKDDLPPADLYALGRILHDWGEEKIRLLLRKIHAALPPGGGLLIAERLLDEDKSGPTSAQMQSLNMLVCTEGRERTQSEYTALLQEAGFRSVQASRTGTPLDALMAIKTD